jgi:hypothetical protein
VQASAARRGGYHAAMSFVLARSRPIRRTARRRAAFAPALLVAALSALASPLHAQSSTGAAPPALGFFVTSVGKGLGADLGGLEGADSHCQMLATAAGAGRRVWRAYLSAQASAAGPAVHARDRIGAGPWHNAQGVLIARNVDELHAPEVPINRLTALTEKGRPVPGQLDAVNHHDILTGSDAQGRALPGPDDSSCGNWTKGAPGSDGGAAIVGHHDRMGAVDGPSVRSWNAAHHSRGCTPEALASTGGAGLFYCFAAR